MNKFIMSVTQNFKKLSVLALLSIIVLTMQSCSKDPDPAPEYAFLNMTNTYPTLATFNIFVDQIKINQGNVPFTGNSGYMSLRPGNHHIKFTTGSSSQALIEQNISLEANSISSLFLIDKEANMDFLIIKDELGRPTSDKAFVRFINLSPNAPALDLAEKDAEVLISDKAFKAYSTFMEVEAKTYSFQLKDKTTGDPIVGGDLESMELKAGKSYTVVAVGLLSATDVQQPFRGKIFTNQ